MKLSVNTGLVVALLLASAGSAMADQRHYQQHQNQNHNNKYRYQHQGKRTVVTKEITENGVIIHKTMTDNNGVTYTLDKKIEKGPHGHVEIEKRRNGQVIERHHNDR